MQGPNVVPDRETYPVRMTRVTVRKCLVIEAAPIIRNALLLGLLMAAIPEARAISVVAAESVYGDIVRQVGGANVTVVDIISSPNLDPHEFEATASTARAVADADLVIYNGLEYDPWASRLLAASPSSRREAIEIAALAGRHAGDNPHLWYDIEAMAALARAVASVLTKLDPLHAVEYSANLARFEDALQDVRERIASMRAKYAGTAVAATEPAFGYMAEALGLRMHDTRFQMAIMNGTEPSARDLADFEQSLQTRQVRLLLYNRQTTGALSERVRRVAQDSHVPTVGLSETLPSGESYQAWMLAQLAAVDRALSGR